MDPENMVEALHKELDNAHSEIEHLSIKIDMAYDRIDMMDAFRQLVYEFLDHYEILFVIFGDTPTRKSAHAWIKEHTVGKYYILPEDEFAFEHASEAVRFKLTWAVKG